MLNLSGIDSVELRSWFPDYSQHCHPTLDYSPTESREIIRAIFCQEQKQIQPLAHAQAEQIMKLLTGISDFICRNKSYHNLAQSGIFHLKIYLCSII